MEKDALESLLFRLFERQVASYTQLSLMPTCLYRGIDVQTVLCIMPELCDVNDSALHV